MSIIEALKIPNLDSLSFFEVLDISKRLHAEHIAAKELEEASGPELTMEQRKFRKLRRQYSHLSKLVNFYKVSEFNCKSCHAVFQEFKEWNAHVNRKKCDKDGMWQDAPVSTGLIQCPSCPQELTRLQSLEDHFIVKHSQDPSAVRTCQGCLQEFSKLYLYQRHYNEEKKSRGEESPCVQKGILCSEKECNNEVVRNCEESINIHNRIFHSEERPPDPFKCLACGETFLSKVKLQYHVKFHRPKKSKSHASQYKTGIESQLEEDSVPSTSTEPTNEVPRRKQSKVKKELNLPNVNTLTLPEVQQLHERLFTEFKKEKLKGETSNTMATEEKERGKKLAKYRNLYNLCLLYKVSVFPCKSCGKRFKKYGDWHIHANVKGCDEDKEAEWRKNVPVITGLFQCFLCPKQVANLPSLEDHCRAKHVDDPKQFRTCGGCSKEFFNVYFYQRHYYDAKKEAGQESPCVQAGLICPNDDCSFRNGVVRNSEEAMNLHNRIFHSAERPPNPFKCLKCDKTFPSKYGLQRHLVFHGDRTFQCDRPGCRKAFKSQGTLRHHIKISHTSKEEGAKRYPCPVCGKEFLNRGGQVKHTKLHDPENKHLCTICGKRFKLTNYLTLHMRSHDPDRKLKYVSYMNTGKYRANRKRKLEKQDREEVSA